MTPTDARVARLPKWARQYIEGLEDRIDGREIDIRPGAVNFVTQTRRECASMAQQRTISIEVWKGILNAP